MQTTPPGYYSAEGDPPGTQRYWDGNGWQGGPQIIPSQTAAIPNPYDTDNTPVIALVLSCIGMAGFLPCAPFGLFMAKKLLREINAGQRGPKDRTLVQAAYWIGAAGTALLCILVTLYVTMIAMVAMGLLGGLASS